ncbi:rhodanese-like domain-containing protein [Helicobacter mesocricetorum]|uniref:rhodanese-like domain-containing protein n=1 Tax=Helicobacter mesocricetorum TaxID=87012 RepID=UPI000CF04DE7|nr:rhodanese-like domain-containing protein [Helicobacter mesocricetorum]
MYVKNKSLATPFKFLSNQTPKDFLGDFIVIDLRSRGYFLISHIQNALNLSSLKRITFIAQENKDKKILLYCHSGATAAEFGTELVKEGLENIYYFDDNYFSIPKEYLQSTS